MDKEGEVLLGKYQLGKLLGQGGFAKVYHARSLKTNQIVAIKIISKEKVFELGLVDQTKREISIMRLLKHPNIVQLYEVMATKKKIYLVMEYAEGGELFQKINKRRLKEEAARRFFQQLITAVDFCHKRGVFHRDLKPENLLLDKDGVLKVSDFGLSAFSESKRKHALLHTTCGTPNYVAPEVIRLGAYDGAKADIWSCGVILFQLLAGYRPFDDSNLNNMFRKICASEYRCPRWFSDDIRKLLFGILNTNPNERFLASDIMRSSWFQEGLSSKIKTEVEDVDGESDDCDKSENQETITPATLSAFDIISLSSGFDLSGLMMQKDAKRSAVQFTSAQSATSIMTKLRDITRKLKLKSKKEGASLKLMKGALSIEAEIFEFTPSFHLVEMKKSNGDTFEFRKMVDEDIRPALKDVVWTWQGERSNNNSSICV
ncbi:PREDICTED: CBL-interacting protein kinase 18-like [Fragaria vesca subsp. vesca]|uniref:CBL-interacting protein kinase 18-like n=1 Tax=Fragaria vesca subsp. vesca TaxID=101020 RepID=UPI0002C3346D|nr:PREDICTED: CBL-interacting protein kinase 18-like [Fragaria vesca subsp. vesca]